MCIFEYIYFARPDSVIAGQSVHQARVNAGKLLAQEHPVEADLVIGVPDSGLDAAQGYAQESGIPYGVGFVKNRYVGRTFITPRPGQPGAGGAHQARRPGQRGGGQAGGHGGRLHRPGDHQPPDHHPSAGGGGQGGPHAHLRAPLRLPLLLRTDIPNKDRLIACSHTVEEIRELTGADSLGYLSLEHLHQLAPDARCGFCDGCFTERYPISV